MMQSLNKLIVNILYVFLFCGQMFATSSFLECDQRAHLPALSAVANPVVPVYHLSRISNDAIDTMEAAARAAVSVGGQQKVGRIWDLLREIRDPIMRAEAIAAVSAEPNLTVKILIATAWRRLLSKIEEDTVRVEASAEFTAAPVNNKRDVAAAWYYLSLVPLDVYHAASTAVKEAPDENKLNVAKAFLSCNRH
jgi:hypothetical protein